MAAGAFTVVAEIVVTGQGEKALDRISKKMDVLSRTAESTMGIFQRLGASFAYSLTGFGGGIVGVLGKAIQSSEKFKNSQLDIMKILGSNIHQIEGLQKGQTRNFAASVLQNISGDAIEWGLNEAALMQTYKTILPMLISKNLGGEGLENARVLSRNLLKSAPVFGLHPMDIQGQLARAVEGGASGGDTMFRRLMSDAPEAFQMNDNGSQRIIKTAKEFNKLAANQRLDILTRAFQKFNQDSELLAERANTLGAIWQTFVNLFNGMDSVLRPLGDYIAKFLIPSLKQLGSWINTHGRRMVKTFVKLLEEFIKSPQDLFEKYRTMSALPGDVKSGGSFAKTMFEMSLQMSFLSWVANMKIGRRVTAFISSFMPVFAINAIKNFVGVITGLGLMPAFGKSLGGNILAVGGAIRNFIGIASLFTIFSQAWQRAMARIDMSRWTNMFAHGSKGAEVLAKFMLAFKKIMTPFDTIIEGWARIFHALLSPVFGDIDPLVTLLDKIADFFLTVGTIIELVTGAIPNALGSLIRGDKEEAGSILMKPFVDLAIRDIVPKNLESGKTNVNQNFSGDINLRQDFKERQEPDRIAFAIKDVLGRAAISRTQSLSQVFGSGSREGGLAGA